MDKFRELELEIDTIIKRLEEKITTKDEEINQANIDLNQINCSIEELKKRISEIEEAKSFLEHYDKKSVILTTIKDLWEMYYWPICTANTKRKLITLITIMILLVASLIQPGVGYFTIGGIVAFSTIVSVAMKFVVNNERKKYPIKDLELVKSAKEADLEAAQEKKDCLSKKVSTLKEKQEKLNKERERYALESRRVNQKRQIVLEDLVPEETLNQKYSDDLFSDEIIRRVREIQKKEGKNNGKII